MRKHICAWGIDLEYLDRLGDGDAADGRDFNGNTLCGRLGSISAWDEPKFEVGCSRDEAVGDGYCNEGGERS